MFIPVENEDSVPSWKAEIQLRRRSKVFIPSQKPDQPIKLVETPKWKLDLAERTKNRRDTDVPKVSKQIKNSDKADRSLLKYELYLTTDYSEKENRKVVLSNKVLTLYLA